jgi:hypothetical protein
MNLYKLWKGIKVTVGSFTVIIYVGLFMDFFLGDNARSGLDLRDIYSPKLKVALLVFLFMCTIEVILLFREIRRTNVLEGTIPDDIGITDYFPTNMSDALAFDYSQNMPKLIKRAMTFLYIKFATVCLFLMIGLALILITNPLLDENMVAGWYRFFFLFKIFFIVLSSIMIVDYTVKIIRNRQ